MKITYINQTLGLGGAETFAADLLDWLNRAGHSVSAFTNNSGFARMLEDKNIAVQSLPLVVDVIGDWKGLVKAVLLFLPAVFYYLYLVWISRNSDVIFMSGYIEKILVTPWAALLGIPVVWLEFAPLETIFKKFLGLPRFLYYLVKDLPRAVIVPSQNTLSRLPPTRSPVFKIPLARNISPSSRTAYSGQRVYCVSRLEPGKGQDLLLQSWPRVISACPSSRLYIVGEGDFIHELTRLTRKLGISRSVTFTGYLPPDRVITAISAAQICVFPSVWPLEGFGLVSIEALSQSLPVVGFSAGPVPEIVTPDCGILVPPGDIPALSRAIIRLLTDSKLCSRMGAAGKKRYLKHYSFATIGPQYVQVFASARQTV